MAESKDQQEPRTPDAEEHGSQEQNPPPQDDRDLFRELMDRLGAIPLGSIRQEAPKPPEKPRRDPLELVRQFSLRPKELRDDLDRFVVSQDDAKKVLTTAVCDHYNHVRRCLEDPEVAKRDYPKANVLMMGPTGVGKTYLMRCIARRIGVPFVKADATKFSETGYVGYDVEDIVRDLVKAADGDAELAQYGIVYIDEVDKLAGSGGNGQKDVSGRGVQVNLLKLLEDSDVRLIAQNDMMGQMQAMMSFQQGGHTPPSTISTKFILFIVSGAFSKLDSLVRRRLGRGVIGFRGGEEVLTANASEAAEASAMGEGDLLRRVKTADLVDYGFEPEFVGRFPVRVALDELGVADLERILTTAENGIWEQYVETMAGYGIELTADQEALHLLAQEAVEEHTGARGLLTVLERLFREYKFELPGTGVTQLHLTRAMLEDPKGSLEALVQAHRQEARRLSCQEVEAFAKRFQEEHGYLLEFTPAAQERLVEKAEEAGKTVRGFCESHFRDFAYGLALLEKDHPERKSFRLDAPDVENPSQTLTQWIKNNIQGEETQL
jgi:ATP-dependent Clp protease ATP-binding subunit ClpX